MKSLAAVNPIFVATVFLAVLVLIAVLIVKLVVFDDDADKDFEAAQRALAMQRHPSSGPHADPYDWEEKGDL